MAAAGIAERSEDADVTVKHDEQREPKTQNHTDQLQPHLPLCRVLSEPHLAQKRLMMAYSVPLHYLFEGNVHSTQAQAAHPDECTRNLGMAGVALPARADGVNDGQVSVKADAGQEKDTTIAVQGEEGTGYLANSQAEHPLVSPLHCKQRQSEGQQEVRNGQVKEEGVCQREGTGSSTLRVSVASDHTQHQHVAHNSQDEHQSVYNRGVLLCKIVDVLLQAWGCTTLAHVRGHGVIVIVFKGLLTRGKRVFKFLEQIGYSRKAYTSQPFTDFIKW